MCGISGFLGSFDPRLLDRMNVAIAHRGPDDQGTWYGEADGIGLAHRRLSIIDLSPRGHQPMWDATGTVAIVYNGEIYNYRELKAGLTAEGFRFQSDCDTEVLLNLYRARGKAMLDELNGMYAFAIWDTSERRLFAARDGLGVKPFYYTQTPKGLVFASELKALLHEPSVERELDPAAVHHYLTYLWCPSPDTMLKGVYKLEPGHAFFARDGRIEYRWRFYDLPTQPEPEAMREADAIRAVRDQLAVAVERQLVSDVPVGAFLSGGLDSSSVVAMAQRAMPDRRLQCFTIGFGEEVQDAEGMGVDLPYAQEVAAHLDVDLHTIQVGSDMVQGLEGMIYQLDEPQADPAPINTWFISQLARANGIKVLLSGTGGDDIFSGYRRHYALQREPLWRWLPHGMRGRIAHTAAAIQPKDENRRRLAKAFRYADVDGDDRIATYFWWIHPDELDRVFSEDFRAELAELDGSDPLMRSLAFLDPNIAPLNRMLYLDGKYFLTDHNLNYGDKIPMAHGVEVRVPLLDPDLVALAARLPIHFKQRGATGKWILRKAMQGILPEHVIHRPKTGFGAPLRYWLRNDLRELVGDVLSQDSLRRRGLFDPQGVQDLIERDRLRQVDAAYSILSMICIELWCRMFVDGPVPLPPPQFGR